MTDAEMSMNVAEVDAVQVVPADWTNNDIDVNVDVPVVNTASSPITWKRKTKRFRAHALDPTADLGANRHTLAQAIAVSLDAQWKTAPLGWQEATCAHFRALHCLPSSENDTTGNLESKLKTLSQVRKDKSDPGPAQSFESLSKMEIDDASTQTFWNPSLRQNVFAAYFTDAVHLLAFLELFANEVYYRRLLDQQPVFVKDIRKTELTAINEQWIEHEIKSGVFRDNVFISLKSKLDHTLMYNILDSVHHDDKLNRQRSVLSAVSTMEDTTNKDQINSLYPKLNLTLFDNKANDNNTKVYFNKTSSMTQLLWLSWQLYCLQASYGVSMAFGSNFEQEKTQFSDFKLLSKSSALLPDRHTDLSVIHAIAVCNLLRIPLTIYKLASKQADHWTVKIAYQTDNTRPNKVDEKTGEDDLPSGFRSVWGTGDSKEEHKSVYFDNDHGWCVLAQDGVMVPHVQLLELDMKDPIRHAFKKNAQDGALERPLKVFTVLSPKNS